MIRSALKTASLAVAATLALGAAAGAATITEPGTGFSNNWQTPTVIDTTTYDVVSGTGKQNHFDFLKLTGLAAGAQDLTFEFQHTNDSSNNDHTGRVIWSLAAAPAWNGTTAGSYLVTKTATTESFTLSLADTFTGDLFLQMLFTSGNNTAYTISIPTAQVPLPAGLGLSLTALGLLGFVGARRRRAA